MRHQIELPDLPDPDLPDLTDPDLPDLIDPDIGENAQLSPSTPSEFQALKDELIREHFVKPAVSVAGFIAGQEAGRKQFTAGMEQTALSLMEKVGILKPGYTEDYTAKTLAGLKEAEEKYPQFIRDNFGYSMGKLGATTAPYMLTPGIQAGFWGNLLYSTAVGGLTGYSMFAEDEQKKLHNAFTGMAFGLGVPIVAEAGKKAAFWYRDHVYKQAAQTKEWLDGEEIIKSMRERGYKDFDLHAGELSSLPSAQTAETATITNPTLADKFFQEKVKRVNQTSEFLEKTITKYAPGSKDSAKVAGDVKLGFEKWKNAAYEARSTNWNNTMGQVEQISGGKRFIRMNSTLAKLGELEQSLAERGTPEKVRAALGKEIDSLKSQLAPRQGGKFTGNDVVTAKEMKNFLSNYRMLSEGAERSLDETSGITKHYYDQIIKALDDDLGAAAKSTKGAAATLLEKARKDYAKDSQYIDNFTLSTVGKLMDNQQFSPVTLAEKLPSLDYPTIKLLKDNLDTIDRGIMRKVGGVMIRDAMLQAKPAPGVSGLVVDPKKLLENLPDDRTINLIFGTSKGKQELKLAADALNRLSTRLKDFPTLQVGEQQQRIAGTMVGGQQSSIFQAMLVARTGFPSTLEKLSTAEGREAIKAAANTKSPVEFVAALSILYADDPEIQDVMQMMRKNNEQ